MIYGKELFTCKRDTLTIRGILLKPQHKGPLPTVIVSHGFGSNTFASMHFARRFAAAGFAAVCFDFCGSGRGKSDGASTDMSILTQQEDLAAVLDHVQTLDFVDISRVVLAGCSQGGLVSALLAAQRAADVHRLILYYPAFSIPDDARRGRMLGRRFDPEHLPDTMSILAIRLGARYALDARKIDPFREISAYSRPVLICHGTADHIVPIHYSQRAAEVYQNAKFNAIPHGGHGFLLRGFGAAMDASLAFLQAE